jgi:hypothetical protein
MESNLKHEGSQGIMKQSEGRVILLMEEKILATNIFDHMTILSYSHAKSKGIFGKFSYLMRKVKSFHIYQVQSTQLQLFFSVRIGDYFKFGLWIFVDFDRSYRV